MESERVYLELIKCIVERGDIVLSKEQVEKENNELKQKLAAALGIINTLLKESELHEEVASEYRQFVRETKQKLETPHE